MAKKKTTKFGDFLGQIYYARVFEETIDDSEYHESTDGQYNLVFIPSDPDDINKMIDLGFPEVSMGNKMIKPFDVADGRMGMKLKRPNVSPSGIENFGGAPSVWFFKDAEATAPERKWDFIEDGDLGNGTLARVKISVYGEGSTASVRLEKIGVVEHVVKEESSGDSDGW